MDYTQNLNLPQFAETDRIHHDDFNAAFAAIDAAMPHIAVGTYIGTGQYGAAHPNTLTFDFVPKLVIVQPEGSSTALGLFWQGSTQAGIEYSTGYGASLNVSWSNGGKTVHWYNGSSVFEQMSTANKHYYLAIG